MKAKEEVGEGPSRAQAAGCGMWDVGAAAVPPCQRFLLLPTTALAAHLSLHSRQGLQGGTAGDGREAEGQRQGSCAALGVTLCQPGLCPALPAHIKAALAVVAGRQQLHSSTNSPPGTAAADGKIS